MTITFAKHVNASLVMNHNDIALLS